jgi:transglutaminase-like putative cysteine protease
MMLRPRESYDQRLIAYDLVIGPTPGRLRSVQDLFGNCVTIAGFSGTTRELTFESRVRLEHTPLPAFAGHDGEVEVYSGAMPFAYGADDLPDLQSSLQRQYPDPLGRVDAWARRFVRAGGRTSLVSLLSDMTQAIYADFKYSSRLQGPAQGPLTTLELNRGSCRDFAVLMMEAVRSLGLAARFVSGYIYSPYSGADRGRIGGGHTHAWVRVYLPACGWVEFDPTNGIVGNQDLVRVAICRDPRQALPLCGTWMGEASDFLKMDVEVEVRAEEDAAPHRAPRAVAMA